LVHRLNIKPDMMPMITAPSWSTKPQGAELAIRPANIAFETGTG